MNRTMFTGAAVFSIMTATAYNSPGGDPVYAQCLATSLNRYIGGGAARVPTAVLRRSWRMTE